MEIKAEDVLTESREALGPRQKQAAKWTTEGMVKDVENQVFHDVGRTLVARDIMMYLISV